MKRSKRRSDLESTIDILKGLKALSKVERNHITNIMGYTSFGYTKLKSLLFHFEELGYVDIEVKPFGTNRTKSTVTLTDEGEKLIKRLEDINAFMNELMGWKYS